MPSKYVPVALRHMVEERAGGCCEYCYAQIGFSPDPFNVEHIQPRTAGGPTTADNLALACFGCNSAKGTHTTAVDPLTYEVVPLYHPRHDKWEAHFQWDVTYTRLVGISAVGRATIALLNLNRNGLVNLRRILHATNAHPPTPIQNR